MQDGRDCHYKLRHDKENRQATIASAGLRLLVRWRPSSREAHVYLSPPKRDELWMIGRRPAEGIIQSEPLRCTMGSSLSHPLDIAPPLLVAAGL